VPGQADSVPLRVHISGSENRPMLPSAQGAISDITHPFHALPACPYTDLCALNCITPPGPEAFAAVHVVPPIAAAAPGARTNRTSWNRSSSSEGSFGVLARRPLPNQACSAAAPAGI